LTAEENNIPLHFAVIISRALIQLQFFPLISGGARKTSVASVRYTVRANTKGQQQRHPIFPDSKHTRMHGERGARRRANLESQIRGTNRSRTCGFIIERGHDSPANNAKLDRDHFLRSNAKIRDATRSSPQRIEDQYWRQKLSHTTAPGYPNPFAVNANYHTHQQGNLYLIVNVSR